MNTYDSQETLKKELHDFVKKVQVRVVQDEYKSLAIPVKEKKVPELNIEDALLTQK